MKQLLPKIGIWLGLLLGLCSFELSAQTRLISGQVLNDQQQPMPGTSVTVKGETAGVKGINTFVKTITIK